MDIEIEWQQPVHKKPLFEEYNIPDKKMAEYEDVSENRAAIPNSLSNRSRNETDQCKSDNCSYAFTDVQWFEKSSCDLRENCQSRG